MKIRAIIFNSRVNVFAFKLMAVGYHRPCKALFGIAIASFS